MCGFFAEYRKKDINFNKNFFLLNARKIKHRGPDDEGEVFLKNFSAKFFRLSILDLSKKANQPMKSISGKFLILFNGEIYNFLKLKKNIIFLLGLILIQRSFYFCLKNLVLIWLKS